ncbi:MAG: hypothetical protein QM601_03530 [Pseudoxanthomonas sp.]
MRALLHRYLLPGLIVQAVIVGGGYATGRELVEFFLGAGPATGTLGIGLTAVAFSAVAMVSFELARRFGAYDYQSFCRIYLGRWSFLFELGYAASLLLVLSVICAAAAKLLASLAGTPESANAPAFMAAVAALVFFGSTLVERLISVWSVVFYLVYGGLFALVLSRHGEAMAAALHAVPVDAAAAARNGLAYAGYNLPVLPILIFVARHFATRQQALVAGALTGPLVLLPGLAFLLTLSAFYPDILAEPLPVLSVLDHLDLPPLALLVRLVILGALLKTGVGLLHGLNERIAHRRGAAAAMPRWVRPAVALAAMGVAVAIAGRIGLIDLIGRGYRYSSLYFLLVFVLPLLTRGLWLACRGDRAPAPVARTDAG